MKDLKYYGREPHKDGLREIVQLNLGLPIEGDLMPGDILLMKFSNEPHHIGIVGDYYHGGLSLIHSHGTIGKVVEHHLNDLWRSRIIEAYRSAA